MQDHTPKCCNSCGEEHPATSEFFEPRSDRPGKLRGQCKNCRRTKTRLRVRKWIAKNRTRHNTNCDRWRKTHPQRTKEILSKSKHAHPDANRKQCARRRALINGAEGYHTVDDIKRQYKTQKGHCWWCGHKLGKQYQVDHRIPLSKGGSNWPSNLVISCRHCNASKRDKLPQDFNGRLL